MPCKRQSRPVAWRASALISLAGEGPARGKALFAPLERIEDACLLEVQGRVEAFGPWKSARLPAGTAIHDLGDVCLVPACANAHTHLQLSWLAGRTVWGQGFAAWLASLVPQITAPLQTEEESSQRIQALGNACSQIASSGTRWLGDVGGSAPGAVSAVKAACHDAGLDVRFFCEWFGFAPPLIDQERPWPPRCRSEIARDPALERACSPCGHALYSTAPEVLRAAHRWCAKNRRIFSFHLAESPEETELLASGTGPLLACYKDKVLPPDWQAPKMRPLAYAAQLGLLGPGTLAVHGVQLNKKEIATLAESGAALCLCPRSNYNLEVGQAPVHDLIESGVLLALGTDGLCTSPDLDVRNEAIWLHEQPGISPRALLRLLTVNGANALGFAPGSGTLAKGQPCAFAVLPRELLE